ncbi:hypothetical protein [Thermovenabulum gondwanense]|uniref:Uncharacterized protein n=1 Tax=Thermovenabulum gondwanense TaxID=520767 RepID=A0A162N460_9FIRM|nr:hypothetical protein [Thermovenabulum gondwanense]KYO69186.1 hypothetical protein ATZ99_00590 [Thermovenabulum gondwanense]
MPYTTCPFCSKVSYSAANLKVWICPYCGKQVEEKDESEEHGDKKQEQVT